MTVEAVLKDGTQYYMGESDQVKAAIEKISDDF